MTHQLLRSYFSDDLLIIARKKRSQSHLLSAVYIYVLRAAHHSYSGLFRHSTFGPYRFISGSADRTRRSIRSVAETVGGHHGVSQQRRGRRSRRPPRDRSAAGRLQAGGGGAASCRGDDDDDDVVGAASGGARNDGDALAGAAGRPARGGAVAGGVSGHEAVPALLRRAASSRRRALQLRPGTYTQQTTMNHRSSLDFLPCYSKI